MNTPAHLLVNLALLGRPRAPSVRRWIAAGALLPDLPMFLFYLWQKGVVGASERRIWGSAYFDASWQTFFDVFNSLPIFVALGVAALATRRDGWAWLSASALLHFVGDAFLHREDGHRHLWPLSDARFMSPVSYWDPAHHGALASALETLAVAVSVALLWRIGGRAWRVALALLAAGSAALWLAYYAPGVFAGA